MAVTAATAVVTVETALQVVSQLLSLIQAAHATNVPIDAGAWNAALSSRDGALEKLDEDIAHSG